MYLGKLLHQPAPDPTPLATLGYRECPDLSEHRRVDAQRRAADHLVPFDGDQELPHVAKELSLRPREHESQARILLEKP